jgi:transcriptional regulator with GAF, ATPase, and Fis domain
MGRTSTLAVTPFKYDGPRAGVTAIDIRTRMKRLKRMAEALITEVGLLEADLERMEAAEPPSVTRPRCLADEVRRLEAAMIHGALVECGWNGADAARRLGIKPTTLHYKLKQYGLCRQAKASGDESLGSEAKEGRRGGEV